MCICLHIHTLYPWGLRPLRPGPRYNPFADKHCKTVQKIRSHALGCMLYVVCNHVTQNVVAAMFIQALNVNG